MPLSLHFHLLGRFVLTVNGLMLERLQAPRLQSLLGYLVLYGAVPLSRQRLAFQYWPETTEGQARTNLRHLLFQIRHDFPELAQCLRTAGGRLAWGSDVHVRADILDLRVAHLRGDDLRVVELYGGDLLPNCDEDWVLDERRRLQDVMADSLCRCEEQMVLGKQYAAAISLVKRRLALEPLHEDAYRKLMRLHALSGDRLAAMRVYQSLEDLLQRELGVGPSLPTRQVLCQVLQVAEVAQPLVEGETWSSLW